MKRPVLFLFSLLVSLQAFSQIVVLSINGPSECCPYPAGGTYRYTVKGVKDIISITWVAENGWIWTSDGQWAKSYTTSPNKLLHEVIVRWDDVKAKGGAQLKISTKNTKYIVDAPLDITLRTLTGILPSQITVSNFTLSNNVVSIPLGTTGVMGCSVQNMIYFKPGEIVTDFIWMTPNKTTDFKTTNSVSFPIGVDNYHNSKVSVRPCFTTECGEMKGESRSFTIVRTGPPITGLKKVEQYKSYSYSISDNNIHSISWSGVNANIVSGQGTSTVTVVPIKDGTATLTASYKYGNSSTIFESKILLSVSKTSIRLIGPDVICDKGDFVIENFPSGATVDWKISNGFSALGRTTPSLEVKNIATPGGSSIYATLTATVHFSGKSIEFTKPITYNVSGIQEDNHDMIYGYLSSTGGECGLSPVPEGASDFHWSVDNNSYWDVDMQGYYFTTFSANRPYNGIVWVTVEFTNACGTRTTMYNSFEVGDSSCYSLYPNPASTSIEIEGISADVQAVSRIQQVTKEIKTVRVFSQMGIMVLEKSFSKGTNKISLDISSLSKGNYIVHIYNGKVWSHKKLMIQR